MQNNHNKNLYQYLLKLKLLDTIILDKLYKQSQTTNISQYDLELKKDYKITSKITICLDYSNL